MEEDHRKKSTIHGRRPLMKDDPKWKATFDERGPTIRTLTNIHQTKDRKPSYLTGV